MSKYSVLSLLSIISFVSVCAAFKTLVLSDIHVVGTYHDQSWENNARVFLDSFRNDTTISRIVLLGDTYNNVGPFDKKPDTLDDLLDSSSYASYFKEFLLNESSKGISIYHIQGNGDWYINQSWWDDYIGQGIVSSEGKHFELPLSGNKYIVFEHGHDTNNPGFGPWGPAYIISRIYAADTKSTSIMDTLYKCDVPCQRRHTAQYWRWAAEEVLDGRDRNYVRSTWAHTFWYTLCLSEDKIDKITLTCKIDPADMEYKRFYVENGTEPYEMAFVDVMPLVYDNLDAYWKTRTYSLSGAEIPHWTTLLQNQTLYDLHDVDTCPYCGIFGMAAQYDIINTLRTFARTLANTTTYSGRNVSAVVLGHTHYQEYLDLYTNDAMNNVSFAYVNVGSWIHMPKGYVEIDHTAETMMIYTMTDENGDFFLNRTVSL